MVTESDILFACVLVMCAAWCVLQLARADENMARAARLAALQTHRERGA